MNKIIDLKRTRAQFYASRNHKDGFNAAYDLLYMLYQYDDQIGTRADQAGYQVSERVRVAFDDLLNNFNGKDIDPRMVLLGMTKAMRDFIDNYLKRLVSEP
jgi:hypothetical protein